MWSSILSYTSDKIPVNQNRVKTEDVSHASQGASHCQETETLGLSLGFLVQNLVQSLWNLYRTVHGMAWLCISRERFFGPVANQLNTILAAHSGMATIYLHAATP